MNHNIHYLEERIKFLEREMERKEIMIDALINEIKNLKSTQHQSSRNSTLRAPKVFLQNELEILDDVVKRVKPAHEETVEEVSNVIEVSEQHENHEVGRIKMVDIKEELDQLLFHKKLQKIFKDNMYLEEFINYCSETINFNFSMTDVEVKGLIKNYVSLNYKQLTKKIVLNVNIYSLSQICTTLVVISKEIGYLEKIILVHDIILYINDYSRLNFIAASLFLNSKFKEDTFSHMMCCILFYQYKVDLEIYKNKKSVLQQLNIIKNNIEHCKMETKLEELLINISTPFDVFINGKVDDKIFEHLYAIRMLSHYLDWDFTYNIYINEFLYPQIEKNRNPLYVLYLGMLTLNAYRIFGKIESTDIVFSYLEDIMKDSSEGSVCSYLILKQVKPSLSEKWLMKFKDMLMDEGFDYNYLKEYLLY